MIYGQFSTKSHNRTYYDLLSLLNIFHQLYNFSLYLRKHKIKSVLSDCDKKINKSKQVYATGRQTEEDGKTLVCDKSDRPRQAYYLCVLW